MEFKIEPNRLKKYIDNALITRGNKPSVDPGVFVFDAENVTFKGMFGGSYGTFQKHKKDFFLEYKCDEEEVVPITGDMNTKLKWGFDTAEITVKTEKDTISFVGKKDKFETTLENHDPFKLPFEIVKDKDMEGYVPLYNYKENPEWDNKTTEIGSIFEVKKDELKLPPGNEYEFVFSEEGLTVRIPDAGTFSRSLEGKVINGTNIKVKVDATYFLTLVENISDTVRLGISKAMILITEHRKDYDKTYFLGTQTD